MGATSFPTQARPRAPTLPREAAAAPRLQLAESLLSTHDAPGGCEAGGGWAAERLGQKLLRLRAATAVAAGEQKLQRERELLLSIINASPDPILLTDPEGRMIISNARADALFSSREGESEGRHRAVTLNNMLFSAALSQQAIDQAGGARPDMPPLPPSDASHLPLHLPP